MAKMIAVTPLTSPNAVSFKMFKRRNVYIQIIVQQRARHQRFKEAVRMVSCSAKTVTASALLSCAMAKMIAVTPLTSPNAVSFKMFKRRNVYIQIIVQQRARHQRFKEAVRMVSCSAKTVTASHLLSCAMARMTAVTPLTSPNAVSFKSIIVFTLSSFGWLQSHFYS